MNTITDPTLAGAQLAEVTPAKPELATLFDNTPFRVDRLALKFTGTVVLDRSDARDVELFRSLKPGDDRTIMVEVRLSGIASKFAEDEDGNVDDVTGQKTLTVHTVFRGNA